MTDLLCDVPFIAPNYAPECGRTLRSIKNIAAENGQWLDPCQLALPAER
jgi:hypothetical protein